MISIDEFIKILANEFDIQDESDLTPETSFRNIKDWSSMHGLIILALSDSEFGVTLTGNDLRELNTIKDLFELIIARTNK